MTIRTLAAVGARLEKAVSALPGEAANPADLYDRYEMLATQILDSEFEDYLDGVLEEYLRPHPSGCGLGFPLFFDFQ